MDYEVPCSDPGCAFCTAEAEKTADDHSDDDHSDVIVTVMVVARAERHLRTPQNHQNPQNRRNRRNPSLAAIKRANLICTVSLSPTAIEKVTHGPIPRPMS